MITATELAKQLDVSKAAISRAIKNGYKCNGTDISALAVKNEDGSVIGYNYSASNIDNLAMRENSNNTLTAVTSEFEPLLTSELTCENEASEQSNDSFVCHDSEPILSEKEQKPAFFSAFTSIKEIERPDVNENTLTTAKDGNTSKLATKLDVNTTAKNRLTLDRTSAKALFFGFIAVGLYRKFSPSLLAWVKSIAKAPTLTANSAVSGGTEPQLSGINNPKNFHTWLFP